VINVDGHPAYDRAIVELKRSAISASAVVVGHLI
jgi:hypothetical protein